MELDLEGQLAERAYPILASLPRIRLETEAPLFRKTFIAVDGVPEIHFFIT